LASSMSRVTRPPLAVDSGHLRRKPKRRSERTYLQEFPIIDHRSVEAQDAGRLLASSQRLQLERIGQRALYHRFLRGNRCEGV